MAARKPFWIKHSKLVRRKKTSQFALTSPPPAKQSTASVRISLAIVVSVAIRVIPDFRLKQTRIWNACVVCSNESSFKHRRSQKYRVEDTKPLHFLKTWSAFDSRLRQRTTSVPNGR